MNNESESISVLFLDVDGVLNTRPGSLDSDKLDLVRWIVAQTGCRIVLSSSWRLNPRQYARICAELPIAGVTPEIGTWERGKEVRAFLDGNPAVRRFAILDDYWKGWGDLEPYAVRTNERVGLTEQLAADAVSLLLATRCPDCGSFKFWHMWTNAPGVLKTACCEKLFRVLPHGKLEAIETTAPVHPLQTSTN